MKNLEQIIENAFEKRTEINLQTRGEIRDAVNEIMNALDCGKLRICQKINNSWQVNQWLKKAILLSFRLNDNYISELDKSSGDAVKFFDKISLKFTNWNENDFRQAGFRALNGAVVRHSAFVAKNVILMPSFVNLGAYVDEGTMVDTWATVGVQRRKEMGRAGNIVDEIRPCRRPSLILNRYCSCALWTERFPKHVDRLRGNRN